MGIICSDAAQETSGAGQLGKGNRMERPPALAMPRGTAGGPEPRSIIHPGKLNQDSLGISDST